MRITNGYRPIYCLNEVWMSLRKSRSIIHQGCKLADASFELSRVHLPAVYLVPYLLKRVVKTLCVPAKARILSIHFSLASVNMHVHRNFLQCNQYIYITILK